MPLIYNQANDSTVESVENKTLRMERFTVHHHHVETKWYWDMNKIFEVTLINAGLIAVLVAIALICRSVARRRRRRQQEQVINGQRRRKEH